MAGGLTITHGEGEGANIDARIYVEVLEIVPQHSVRMEIRSRKKDPEQFTLSWKGAKKIGKDIFLSVGKYKQEHKKHNTVPIEYRTSGREYPIVRVDYRKVEDPWRPAREGDGISKKDFKKPRQLLVEQLKDGTKLACAWDKQDVTYRLKWGRDKYILIARMVGGKIVPPDIPNIARVDYASPSEDIYSHLMGLARLKKLYEHFILVPNISPHSQEESETLRKIEKRARRFRTGEIEQSDLAELVWGYQARTGT